MQKFTYVARVASIECYSIITLKRYNNYKRFKTLQRFVTFIVISLLKPFDNCGLYNGNCQKIMAILINGEIGTVSSAKVNDVITVTGAHVKQVQFIAPVRKIRQMRKNEEGERVEQIVNQFQFSLHGKVFTLTNLDEQANQIIATLNSKFEKGNNVVELTLMANEYELPQVDETGAPITDDATGVVLGSGVFRPKLDFHGIITAKDDMAEFMQVEEKESMKSRNKMVNMLLAEKQVSEIIAGLKEEIK